MYYVKIYHKGNIVVMFPSEDVAKIEKNKTTIKITTIFGTVFRFTGEEYDVFDDRRSELAINGRI